MDCPNCASSATKVVDSRGMEATVRRRRHCIKCACKYTTIEILYIDDKRKLRYQELGTSKINMEKSADKKFPSRAVGMYKKIFNALDAQGYIYWDKPAAPYFLGEDGKEHFIVDLGGVA